MQEQVMTLKIVKVPLPSAIHGVSAATSGQRFTILINETDDPERQAQAFLHEMLHIWHGDHDAPGASVDQLERKRHAEIERFSCL